MPAASACSTRSLYRDGYRFLTQETAHAICHVTEAREHRHESPCQEGLTDPSLPPSAQRSGLTQAAYLGLSFPLTRWGGGMCPLLQGQPLVCTGAAPAHCCKGGHWSALGQWAVFTVTVRQNLSSDSTLSRKQHDLSSIRVAM